MINLVCKECKSKDITFINKESSDEDNFKCNDCGSEFTFKEAGWETEW